MEFFNNYSTFHLFPSSSSDFDQLLMAFISEYSKTNQTMHLHSSFDEQKVY